MPQCDICTRPESCDCLCDTCVDARFPVTYCSQCGRDTANPCGCIDEMKNEMPWDTWEEYRGEK